MKNTFGNNISLTLFGESHGSAVGCVIDGLASGITVSEENIEYMLSKRRPSSSLDTPRREIDSFKILSGVFNGKTTGTPICIVIENADTRSSDYKYGKARPSHADYSAYCKYHGFEDYRGGGHFSGRVTAALVAAGGIFIPMLENIGIHIGTHIFRCKDSYDRDFTDIKKDIELLGGKFFPVLDESAEALIIKEIMNAKAAGDSVGGKTQSAVVGLPAGMGEPWFDSVEGVLSHALFSLGGIKGVAFGAGFDACSSYGSEYNDSFFVSNGKILTETNNNGGINGGITNGMPLVFECAVKPTPTISRNQKTVDFIKGENIELASAGRHDPAIIRRICPVIDSVTAFCICDMMATRYGTDFPHKEGEY